ncbi:MAG: alpha/beta hydrolase [Cyanobacteria bacterium P01_E01_bin.6]
MNHKSNSKVVHRWLVGDFSLARLVRSSLLIYGIFAAYVFFRADSMIFVPPESSYADTPDILKIPTTGDRHLSALMIAPETMSFSDLTDSEQGTINVPNISPEMPYVLLYSHGNAEDLGLIRPVLDTLTQAGVVVFAYDYQGYGTSDGQASEQGAYADIDAAYQYLTEERGVVPERIILHGRSVGGGPSVDLAAREPVAGLILESTFTTAFRTVIPFPILPFDKFHNLRKVDDIGCPVLIIHGTADQTIPLWHGETLFEHALAPKEALWIEGAGHNDLVWVAGDRYINTIKRFIDQLDTTTSSPEN